MDLELLISTFVTLFVIVDPIGLVPIFLAVTHGMSGRERRRAAVEAALVSFGVLAGALLIGEWLLRNLGIGLPAFRIAGGVLLFVIGFEMLFDRRQRRKADDASDVVQERQSGVAIFPLAIPLMSGPGAITAAVLLSSNADGDAASLLSLLGVFALVIGILLAALAVQFIVDGIAEVFALGGG